MARCIVVAGGSLAGIAAARRAREIDPRGRIVLIERRAHLNVAAAGIAQLVSGEAGPARSLESQQRRTLGREHRVELRMGTVVTRIDARTRVVECAGGDSIECDALVFAGAAGSQPVNLPGIEGASNVLAFRTIEDAARIQAARKAGARTVAEGVDKRLDVLATAVMGGLTVDDLAGLDFGHAPLFAPVRDVLNVAAQAAVDGMKKRPSRRTRKRS